MFGWLLSLSQDQLVLLLVSVQEVHLLLHSLVQGHGEEEKLHGTLAAKVRVLVRRFPPEIGSERSAKKISFHAVGIVLQILDDWNEVEQLNLQVLHNL